jgi:hypothetical protein
MVHGTDKNKTKILVAILEKPRAWFFAYLLCQLEGVIGKINCNTKVGVYCKFEGFANILFYYTVAKQYLEMQSTTDEL